MKSRRNFISKLFAIAFGSMTLPLFIRSRGIHEDLGVQLYTFRHAMLEDPKETLSKVAELGIKYLESARSDRGLYYGLTPL